MPKMRKAAHPRLAPDVVVLRRAEYRRFKQVLNAARHPTFVGRDTFDNIAREGGAFVFCRDGEDIAVALVKTRHSVLTALSVAKGAQGSGVGTFAVDFLRPNWVRATAAAVAFFERLGYQAVGAPRVGRSLTTQVMVRSSLLQLAGRVSRVYAARQSPSRPRK